MISQYRSIGSKSRLTTVCCAIYMYFGRTQRQISETNTLQHLAQPRIPSSPTMLEVVRTSSRE